MTLLGPEALEVFWNVSNTIGLISFAISGSIKAIKRGFDIFGIIFIGLITSIGGGTIRDMILGRYKETIFLDSNLVLLSIIFALLFYIIWHFNLKIGLFKNSSNILSVVYNFTDAVGLAAFTVVGSKIAKTECGLALLPTALISTITCIGGGIIRDLLVGEVPEVLERDIYASIAFFGGIMFWFLSNLQIPISIISVLLFLVLFVFRMVIIKLKLNMVTVKK